LIIVSQNKKHVLYCVVWLQTQKIDRQLLTFMFLGQKIGCPNNNTNSNISYRKNVLKQDN